MTELLENPELVQMLDPTLKIKQEWRRILMCNILFFDAIVPQIYLYHYSLET